MNHRGWLRRHLFFVIGVLFTPIALAAAVWSAGAGHGSYSFAKLLFPYTMLLTLAVGGMITLPLVLLAAVQFPVAGLLLDWAKDSENLLPAVIVICLAHFLAVALSFVCLPNFT